MYCHDLRLSHEPTQDGLSNVTFLLVVMKSIGMYQPITEYFTVQLEIELEAAQRGRNCKLGQGRILSSPGNQRCDTSESRSRNGDEDSQSRESNSVDEVGNMLSNLQLPQPMAGILLHRCPHDDASEIRSVKTVNDSSSNSSSPQGQEHVRIVGGPFAAGHKLPSNSPGTPFNNPSHYSVQRSAGPSHVQVAPNPRDPMESARIDAYNRIPPVHEWNDNFAMPSQSYHGQGYPGTLAIAAENSQNSDQETNNAPREEADLNTMSFTYQSIPFHTRGTAFDTAFSGVPLFGSFDGTGWESFNDENWDNWT